MVKAIVLSGFGINCEEESAAAYRLAGARADIVHLSDLFAGLASIGDYDIVHIPGGFSFGDDLGSGRVLADMIRYRKTADGSTLLDQLDRFRSEGGFILGICNGFQVLVQAGLLPDVGGKRIQDASLTFNASGRFEDRWVTLAVAQPSRTPFLAGVESLYLPVRHGEGRLVFGDGVSAEALVKEGLAAARYAGADGLPTETYPENPNGSPLGIAALTDGTGRVLGMMPHPEAAIHIAERPDRGLLERQGRSADELTDGFLVFRNIVKEVRGEG
jgi:phosphoribosylformylglycinamidine synthase subunit PurQ / glutaminase